MADTDPRSPDSQASLPLGREQSRAGRSLLWYVGAGTLALVLGLGTLATLRVLLQPLAVLFLGMTLAATLAPPVSWLAKRIPRALAVVAIYVVLVLVLLGIGWLTIPPLVHQVEEFGVRLPEILDPVQRWFEQWQRTEQPNIVDALTTLFSSIGSAAFTVPAAITSSLAAVLLVIFVSVYWLILAPDIEAFFLSLFPEDIGARLRRVFANMAEGMGGFLRGAVINGLIVGLLTYIGLLVIGADFPIVLGVLAGVLEIFPVVGPIVATIIIVVVTLFQSPTQALIAFLFLVVLQQLENHLLVPNIMKSQTHVSPLLTILMLFAGASVGGLLGAAVAIPLAAALRVLVVDLVAPGVRRLTGSRLLPEDGATREGS